jgi:hypothetical protein
MFEQTEMSDPNSRSFPERRWIVLNTSHDVESWINNYNQDLRRAIGNDNASGYGICLRLAAGGEIFMHTTPDGDVLLDVTPEAEWASPVIAAATGVAPPDAQIWALPGHVLTQLLLGLSSLIEATRIIVGHDFRIRKNWKAL